MRASRLRGRLPGEFPIPYTYTEFLGSEEQYRVRREA